MDCKMVKAEMTLRSGGPPAHCVGTGRMQHQFTARPGAKAGQAIALAPHGTNQRRQAHEPLSDSVATRLAPRKAGTQPGGSTTPLAGTLCVSGTFSPQRKSIRKIQLLR
jgi:hypothetical protein